VIPAYQGDSSRPLGGGGPPARSTFKKRSNFQKKGLKRGVKRSLARRPGIETKGGTLREPGPGNLFQKENRRAEAAGRNGPQRVPYLGGERWGFRKNRAAEVGRTVSAAKMIRYITVDKNSRNRCWGELNDSLFSLIRRSESPTVLIKGPSHRKDVWGISKNSPTRKKDHP